MIGPGKKGDGFPMNETLTSQADMQTLLVATAERAARYLDGLAERRVAPLPADVAGLDRLGGPLPEGPADPAAVLAQLDDVASPATVASAGPRYFGFVIGGSLPAALAANWLAGAWDQDAGLRSPRPGTAAIEQIALGWLLELLGLPAGTEAGFVTGATMANFTALAAARHAVLQTGLGRGSAGAVRRPAHHGLRRRRGAHQRAQGAEHAGHGPRAPAAAAGRRPGPHAPERAAAIHRPGHRLPPGRQRQHRRVRPVGRALRRAHAAGRLGTRRRRVWALGRPPALPAAA